MNTGNVRNKKLDELRDALNKAELCFINHGFGVEGRVPLSGPEWLVFKRQDRRWGLFIAHQADDGLDVPDQPLRDARLVSAIEAAKKLDELWVTLERSANARSAEAQEAIERANDFCLRIGLKL